MILAGVDIGNSTTEVCIGECVGSEPVRFLSSASVLTTGTKGTPANIHGIKAALTRAMASLGRDISEISLIRLNEAAPVIGDTAMETLTETIITDSSMIGHNPSTPAGRIGSLYCFCFRFLWLRGDCEKTERPVGPHTGGRHDSSGRRGCPGGKPDPQEDPHCRRSGQNRQGSGRKTGSH